MQRLSVAIAVLILGSPGLAAQEKPKAGRPQRASFFESPLVDFWGMARARRELPKKGDPGKRKAAQESIWAQPIQLPDGRMTVRVPPKAVVEFLENPTMETGRAYVRWQTERMKQFRTAAEVLQQLRSESDRFYVPQGSAPSQPPSPREGLVSPSGSRVKGAQLLYFKQEDCPWCVKQDEVLEKLRPTMLGIQVLTFTKGDAPALERGYGIEKYPTLIVLDPEGGRTMLRGFMPLDRLRKLLGSRPTSSLPKQIGDRR